MNPGDRARDEQRLFDAALLLPPEERADYVRRACGADELLRHGIEVLLQEHGRPQDALDYPPGSGWRTAVGAASAPEPLAGETVASGSARYVLGELLGEGGWGAVHAAEQEHPVRRSVAIKVVKLGMDTRAVVARFHAERQALARMDHDGIARVFDAGATAQGRPFFAMERVRGVRITRFCDERRLALRERIALFIRVCQAVQHAHQKGVIHRDLKPSNLLVADADDGTPRPKIIDFGIAKAAQGRLTDETLVTELDGFVGTPAYSSPEQADNRGDAVDTRTDLYSLGVVLYELLTGTTPIEIADLRSAGTAEVRRLIREVEPPAPSSRVAGLTETARRETAALRRLSPARLRDALAGDLDRVTLKCLEKDPACRYESAASLADDLARFLRDEPVAAVPPGTWYVLGKFARRHRAGLALAAVAAVLLVAGTVVSTVFLFRERAALARAGAEAERSARSARFFIATFQEARRAASRGHNTELLREMTADAMQRLKTDFTADPALEAELSDVVADVLWGINEPQAAIRLRRRVLEVRERLHGPDAPEVASALQSLAIYTRYHGEGSEAERLYRRAHGIRARILGPDHPATIDVLQGLAFTLTRQRRLAEAFPVLAQVQAAQRRTMPPDDPRLLDTEVTIASAHDFAGNPTEAIRIYRDVAERAVRSPAGAGSASNPVRAWTALAGLLVRTGRLGEALPFYRLTVAERTAQHRREADHELRMARVLWLLGERDEALAVTASAVGWLQPLAQRDKSWRIVAYYAAGLGFWGECLLALGRTAEAEPMLREAARLTEVPVRFFDRHPVLAWQVALDQLGRAAEADTALADALRRTAVHLSPYVFQIVPRLHGRLVAGGRTAEAAALLREQLAVEERLVADMGAPAAEFSMNLLCALLEIGEAAVVEPLARARLEWWTKNQPDGRPAAVYRGVLGDAIAGQGRFAEAEPDVLRSSAALFEWINRTQPESLLPDDRLVGSLERFHRASDRPEAPGRWREILGGQPANPEWRLRLAHALAASGRHSEAAEILPEATAELREATARGPRNERLESLVAEAVALAQDCADRVAPVGAGENPPNR